MVVSTDNATAAVIIDRISQFVHRFVFLQKTPLYRLVSTWVLATHMHARFQCLGYLFIYSPEPSCGKSRLLEVLDLLVFKSSGILVSPTPAVLFRTAAGKTQLLDEADGWTNAEQLRSLLNAGFQSGGKVVRCDCGANGEFKPLEFPVYGPRALAGIGREIFDATTKDRTFMVAMARQTPWERRERFLRNNVVPEAQGLKQEIESWVQHHVSEVVERYSRGDFRYLESFRDRTIDVAQPLFAILEVAYAGREELASARLDLIEAITIAREDQQSLLSEHRLLQELARLACEEDPLTGTASELAARCSALPEVAHEYSVSQALRKHGFQTRSVRRDGTPKHRYVLPRAVLADLCNRYACSGDVVEPRAETGVPTTPQPADSEGS